MNLLPEVEIQKEFLEEVTSDQESSGDTSENEMEHVNDAANTTFESLFQRGEISSKGFSEAADSLYSAIQNGSDAEETFELYGESWASDLFSQVDDLYKIDRHLETDAIYREMAGLVVAKENPVQRVAQILNPVNAAKGIKEGIANIHQPTEVSNYSNFEAEIDGYSIEELEEAAETGYERALRNASGTVSGAEDYDEWLNSQRESDTKIEERVPVASD